MEFLKAIIIGIIQGLTEFLPVSSSGHIEISKVILNLNLDENENLLFTLVLHLATALSTILVFRKDVLEIIRQLLRGEKEGIQFTLNIVISMIPAAFVGLVFKDEIEALFNKNMLLVGSMLILTGLLLLIAGQQKNNSKKIDIKDALVIGIAQAVAILPGVSRSGSTIATSVILGNQRSAAARFSVVLQ